MRQPGTVWDGERRVDVTPPAVPAQWDGKKGWKPQRSMPRIDPEIVNGEHPNDFDRWMDGQRTEARGQRSDVGQCVGV